MRLPNADHAFIAPSKLAGYLLSGTHPAGQSKAKFFRAVGFDETTLSALQAGLLIIAKECEVTQVSSPKRARPSELPTPWHEIHS
jgi:hypothetical protein